MSPASLHAARRPGGAGRAAPWGYLVLALALVAVWIYLPLALTGMLSVTSWDLIGTPRLVGIANYQAVLGDPDSLAAFDNTALYALAAFPLLVVLPVPVAVAVWKHAGHLRSTYRLALFFPVIVAPVMGAYLWQWVINPTGGILPGLLAMAGVPSPPLLQSSRLALWTIVGLTTWKMFGLSVVLYQAGLAGVDRALLDAARTDGAGEWQVTKHVLLPALRPTAGMVAFLALISVAQWSFAFINVLTQGGPGQATSNALYRVYELGLLDFDGGQASAVAVLFFVVIGGLALLALTLGRRGATAVRIPS